MCWVKIVIKGLVIWCGRSDIVFDLLSLVIKRNSFFVNEFKCQIGFNLVTKLQHSIHV